MIFIRIFFSANPKGIIVKWNDQVDRLHSLMKLDVCWTVCGGGGGKKKQRKKVPRPIIATKISPGLVVKINKSKRQQYCEQNGLDFSYSEENNEPIIDQPTNDQEEEVPNLPNQIL